MVAVAAFSVQISSTRFHDRKSSLSRADRGRGAGGLFPDGVMKQSIFERNGGFATLRKVVSAFYDKVLDSPGLQRYFADIDMRALVDHQTKFVASVMGGPASFSDDVLRRVHEPLGISRAEFDEVVSLMCETLQDHDVSDDDIEHVRKELMKREMLIVSRR